MSRIHRLLQCVPTDICDTIIGAILTYYCKRMCTVLSIVTMHTLNGIMFNYLTYLQRFSSLCQRLQMYAYFVCYLFHLMCTFNGQITSCICNNTNAYACEPRAMFLFVTFVLFVSKVTFNTSNDFTANFNDVICE